MATPEEGEADSARLDSLASQMVGMSSVRAMSDVEDLAAFGLEDPEVEVTLVLSDGMAIGLTIGAENPRGNARYMQKEGDPLVYVVTPISVLNSLIGLVSDPPYPPTPVPTQSPLPTPQS
jgi:hypothetical protein